ncbi:MAG: MOSC N-terminal beta barrel domain-containing protein [Rhodanobacteraceae bacterium]
MPPKLANLHIYPLKSGAPLALEHARVEPRGLEHDRRWMVVDDNARFLTARTLPRLTLIRAVPAGNDALQLAAPGAPPLHLNLPMPNRSRIAVTVWNDTVDALPADAEADAWISRFLDLACRLVYMDDGSSRGVDRTYAREGDQVSFADGFPLLAISQAALDQLNDKLAQPVSMLRFRPNLVISGTEPHAEDDWKQIRIGGTVFDVVKPCMRCVLTTVDFERGMFDADGEPLRTLKTYRRGEKGISFGENLIPRGSGELKIGDSVEVLA